MDDSELNAELKQLAVAAQGHPVGSPGRQRSLNQLVRTLQASRRLSRPPRREFDHLNEEICAEAHQRLFIYVCNKIDLYRPEHEVMQWVNFMLNRRFFYEARQECISFYRPDRQRLSAQPWLTVEDVERSPALNPAQPTATPTLEQQARDYVETDPEGLLAQAHVRNRPDVTFQVLLLRVLDGYKWHEIAAEFTVALPTLHSLYRRQLKRLAPQLRSYLAP